MVKVEVCLDEYNKAKKGDVLFFDGKKWGVVPFEKLCEQVNESLNEHVKALGKRNNKLETKVRKLELTIAYDHGEINKEQYEKEIANL